MSWGELFDRAEAYEVDLATVRETVTARRESDES